MKMNHCYLGDCREVMKSWPSGIADACITDPPYGDTGLEWDRVCDGWIPEVSRVLKPNGSIWVFGSLRFLIGLVPEMEAAGFKVAQDIIWEKHNGTSLRRDRFRRVHEQAVHFYRGRWSDVFKDPQYQNGVASKKTIRRTASPAHWGKINPGIYTSDDGGPLLETSVIKARSEHGRAIHPTQKPMGIIAPLLRYSVPENGIVIDPFCGSGSVGVVAELLGRQWIGCELNPKYLDGQSRRMSQQTIALEVTA